MEGDTVIILADINKVIREEPIHLMVQQMGLIETIITQHGTHGPNTHNCGTNPINGIFIPSTLIQDVTSGYLTFGEGIPSNHRAVWIDLPLVALGWFNIPESVPLQARRLKCNDPRIVQWYNKALQEKLNQHQLAHCIKTLTQQVQHHRLTRKQKCEYEDIDHLSSKVKNMQNQSVENLR